MIYATIVEQDVGKLLLAGFVPGAFSALIYGLLIVGMALTIKGFGPPVSGFTWKERFASLPPALPIIFVVVTIIFFVYNPFGGDAWGTPTEGGAVPLSSFSWRFIKACAGKTSRMRCWKPRC